MEKIREKKREEIKMPYITVESGVLSDTQKEELIKRLTEISSEIMKIPQDSRIRLVQRSILFSQMP